MESVLWELEEYMANRSQNPMNLLKFERYFLMMELSIDRTSHEVSDGFYQISANGDCSHLVSIAGNFTQ